MCKGGGFLEFRRRYKKLIDLIMLLLIITVLTLTIKYYFKPFIWMVIMFLIANPLYKFFIRLNIHDKIAGALSILFVNLALIIFVIYLGGSIFILLKKLYEGNIKLIEDLIRTYIGFIDVGDGKSIAGSVISILNQDFIKTGAITTGEGIVAFFIGNICAFFILVDREKMKDLVKRLIPRDILYKAKYQGGNFKQMIGIQVILVLISTLEIIIGFIVPGVASLGNKSGKTLLLTIVLAYTSTLIAGFLAFIIGFNLLPKFINGGFLLEQGTVDLTPYFTIDIPPMLNIMSALVFAFILGVGLSRIKNSNLLKVFEEFSSIVEMVIKNILIPLVPFYIFSIFAKLSFSGEIFTTLKAFGIVYIILFTLQIGYILIQYIVAGSFKKQNPLKLIKNMIPAYFTAVGTQSSAATIPVTLESTKNNNVSEEISDFVIPLCATIHLAGDTIALVLTSMGVMYMNGQTPTFSSFLPFILMLGITMVAAPGVPGGGVMAALGILEMMLGFGSVEKSIMIALHAAQDSFGTATNITGDGALAIIIDKIAGKKKELV